MAADLVEIVRKQAATTSLKVAEVFDKPHADVLKSIDRIISDCAEMASEQEKENYPSLEIFRKSTYEVEGQLRKYPMYYMNRDGFTLLAMGFTGKKALKFKLDYINAFNRMEQIILQRENEEWRAARKLASVDLLGLTDVIKERLIPLMIEQGASPAALNWVYKNYVSMIQKLLNIPTGGRDELPLDLLYELSKVEQMAKVIIKGLVSKGSKYKQIYIGTKDRLGDYAQISLFNQRFLGR